MVGIAARTTRRRGPFVVLEAATLLSGTGNAIATVALPWIVLERTGDAVAAGLVGAATALPLLVSGLFSGTIIDVVGRRRSAVVADLLSLVSVAAIPLVDASVGLTVVTIAALAALGAAFDPAGVSAREAMLPAAAEAGGYRLARINGIHEATWGLAFLVGPGLGGLLIGWIGAVSTLWATAIAFGVSALLSATLRLANADAPLPHERPAGLLRGTAEGVRFVWRTPLLRAITLLSAALIGVYLPVEGVFLPVHFEELDEPTSLGLVITCMGAGGVVGALLYGAVGHRLRRHRLFVGALLATSIALLGMALLPPTGVLAGFGALVGLAFGPVDPMINLAMQVRTPERLRGRVVGVVTSAAYAAGPLGFLVAGPLVQAVGVETAFLISAVGIVVIAVSALALRSLRELDGGEFDVEPEPTPGHAPFEAPVHPAA